MLVNSRPADRNNPDFNSEAALKEAKAKYPLERVIEGYGFGPKDGGSLKSFTCPFCNKKNKAGVHYQAGDPLFKCFSTSCPSEAKSMGPVEFIMLKEGYGRKDAFTAYLKMAGVWKERTRFKAPQAEAQSPKPKAQKEEANRNEHPGADSQVLAEAQEQVALKVPQGVEHDEVSTAAGPGPTDETGPAVFSEKVEVGTGDGPSPIQADWPPKLSPQEREEQDARLAKLFLPPEPPKGASALPPTPNGAGPSPLPGISPSPNASVSGAIPPTKSKDALPLEPHGALSASAPIFSSTHAVQAPGEMGFSNPVLPPGPVLPEGAKVEPGQLVSGALMPGGHHGTESKSKNQESGASGEMGPTVVALGNVEEVDFGGRSDDAVKVVRTFYEGLALSPEDEERIWLKRGLESRTIEGLGFRSNAKSNRDLLLGLERQFSDSARTESGLFRKARNGEEKPQPSSKFYGYGRVRKLTAEEKKKRKAGDDEEFLWGWTHLALIPYFDEKGALISLRPHKEMGAGDTVVGTPHVYVPREPMKAASGRREKFFNVVITEGEFKAAALWQMVGSARDDEREAWGVCALPGINMAKNYEVREELNWWLSSVGARRVVVAYDEEEKGDPKLPSYKPEKWKRFDSIVWARYLALDLSQRMHVKGEVAVLPRSWRDKNGKADWDGALQRMVHATGKAEG